jgi:hypothetical protein
MGYVLEATYRHGGGVTFLRSREDIDRFVNELLAAGWEYTAATVYTIDEATDVDPDHELVIGANPKTDLGAVRYSGEGTWWSRGEQTNPLGVEFAYFGTGQEFPADSEVPLAIVREAMWELLTTGGKRPGCVHWQEWTPEARAERDGLS